MSDVVLNPLAAAIALQNDTFRRAGPNHDWVVTRGVAAKGDAFLEAAIRATMEFVGFDPDNDPHGERDFGDLSVAGVRVWFKIDYYDQTLAMGSDDPSNSAITRRVLTLLLPDEY